MSEMIINKTKSLYTTIRVDHPEWSIFLFVLTLSIVGYFFYSCLNSYFQGVLIEFTGFIFDVFFITIVLAWLYKRKERKLEIASQKDIIDDFKAWDSPEAHFRIAGSLRRLARLGISDIDFSGMRLSDFSFPRHDIHSLKGSIFHSGDWGSGSHRDETLLKRVTFDRLDLQKVQFSPYDIFEGFDFIVYHAVQIEDCTFKDADLRGAKFNGATLTWTKENPEKMYEDHILQDGSHASEQIYFPPFSDANIAGTSFERVRFSNIDFRNAEGVLEAYFCGAKGLETCLFDDEHTKQKVLDNAQVDTTP